MQLKKRSWTQFVPSVDFEHHHPTEVIHTAEQMKNVLSIIRKKKSDGQDTLAIDTETTGLDVLSFTEKDLVSFSLSDGENAWYFPIHHIDVRTGKLEANQIPVKAVRNFLDILNKEFRLVYFNAKYDWGVFKTCLNLDMNIFWDVLISGWLLNAGVERTLGLKARALRDLGIKMQEISDLIDDGNYRTFDTVAIESASQYAGSDAFLTYKLFKQDVDRLKKFGIPYRIISAEMSLVRATAKMERNGMRLDISFLREYIDELHRYVSILEPILFSVGGDVNFNSPAQMSKLLFEKLGFPQEISGFIIEETATGHKTGKRELNALLDANVEVDKKNFLLTLLEYKKVTKTISTMQGWLDRKHPLTGKLHANFNQIGTSTGRYSSSNPNLQNIPSRDWDSGVRRCFVADEDYVLVEIDYSQAEVRVLAHYSNDPILLGIFGQEGLAGDPHTVTASRIWHIELEEVTKLQRTMAKQVTFGLPYGISPFGLWRRLVNDFDVDVTQEEVEELVANYLKLHSGVNEYLEATKEEVSEKGYIRNLVGIRRAFPVIKSRGKGYAHEKEVDRAKRQAVNHPIQGTVATMVKLSMVEADKLLDKPEYAGGQMIGQVHDSIMFHLPEKVADAFIAEFLPIMCGILPLRVAMEADAEKGKSLYEVKGGKDAIASLHEHEEKFLASIGYKTT